MYGGFTKDLLSLNRYTYVKNNSLTYVDPLGHFFVPILAPLAVGTIEAIAAFALAATATVGLGIAYGTLSNEGDFDVIQSVEDIKPIVIPQPTVNNDRTVSQKEEFNQGTTVDVITPPAYIDQIYVDQFEYAVREISGSNYVVVDGVGSSIDIFKWANSKSTPTY